MIIDNFHVVLIFCLIEVTINRLKEKLREYEEKIEDRVQVMYEYWSVFW